MLEFPSPDVFAAAELINAHDPDWTSSPSKERMTILALALHDQIPYNRAAVLAGAAREHAYENLDRTMHAIELLGIKLPPREVAS